MTFGLSVWHLIHQGTMSTTDQDITTGRIRVYGGRQRYFSIADVFMYTRITANHLPGDLRWKIIRKIPSGYLAELTLPWLDYKIDLEFSAAKTDTMAKVRIVPTTAQMIVRASSVRVKSRKDKGCVKMTLGNYAITRGRWESPEIKKVGDITLENVLRIAKQVHDRSMAATFLGTVKQVIGQVHTLGLTIDNKPPRFYHNRIDEGLKFIDEAQILPYLDEGGAPWHVLNPREKNRNTWYILYPKLTEEDQLLFEDNEQEEEVEEVDPNVTVDHDHLNRFANNQQQVDEYLQGGEKKVALVCKHWLQQMCNKGDTCQYLHTMHRE